MAKTPDPKDVLRAVFASGVAVGRREGLDMETAVKNTHAAIDEQLRRAVATPRDREADEG